jgi:hypothetical protein
MITLCPGNPSVFDLHEGGSITPISFLAPAASQVGSTLQEDIRKPLAHVIHHFHASCICSPFVPSWLSGIGGMISTMLMTPYSSMGFFFRHLPEGCY